MENSIIIKVNNNGKDAGRFIKLDSDNFYPEVLDTLYATLIQIEKEKLGLKDEFNDETKELDIKIAEEVVGKIKKHFN